MLGAWPLVLLLFFIGAAIELARLLNSDDEITLRFAVGRMLAGAITAMLALLVKVRSPDIEDLAVVGLGAAVAAVGYTAVQPTLKRVVRALLNVRQGENDREDKP